MTRQPNESELQQIKALLQAGQKEEAMRMYQKVTQAGILMTQNAIKELEQAPDHLADIRLLVQQGDKIRAVKLYYERTAGIGLQEAKRAIDAMSNATSTPTDNPAPTPAPTPSPSSADGGKIDQYILRGEKVMAIKLYREQHRVGLKEAKDAVDARDAVLRVTSPKQFQKASDFSRAQKQANPPKKAGWGIVFFMVLLLLGLICSYAYMRLG